MLRWIGRSLVFMGAALVVLAYYMGMVAVTLFLIIAMVNTFG